MGSDKNRRASVLGLFKAGKSKREIALALGITKDEVKRDLAIAIREGATPHDAALDSLKAAADSIAGRIGLNPGDVVLSIDEREDTITASAQGASVTIHKSDSTSYLFPSLLHSAIAARLQTEIREAEKGATP